jgi:hypothetical protein
VRDALFPFAHLRPAADERGDVEVILHVLDGAVVGQLVEDLLNLLLGGGHTQRPPARSISQQAMRITSQLEEA